jgi:hypothetical protein
MVTLENGYIILRIKGRRIREHRKIWIEHYGEIPKGQIIHHKNGIRTDNRIENLQCLKRDVHRYLHHGNHWSEEHKKKVSEKLKGIMPKNILQFKENGKKTQFKKGCKVIPHKPGCKCFRCKLFTN